ncbi:isoeugenol monooxygenase [Pseudozyma hubeiensis SY62]|uniref:Isoeugenol monooxygenase n=1 Tax=Pseudozyma hubeiensis (strain SY62) TaxID=1305764 RepID=R9P3Y1_PSEHS|nr:isoeugenol monooxygenase [Pseudozyma hubeiensis SY62]GAC96004.1 isoeugenol monooxygenase [Pseudozyma hubeiensis SY62]
MERDGKQNASAGCGITSAGSASRLQVRATVPIQRSEACPYYRPYRCQVCSFRSNVTLVDESVTIDGSGNVDDFPIRRVYIYSQRHYIASQDHVLERFTTTHHTLFLHHLDPPSAVSYDHFLIAEKPRSSHL